MDVDFVLAQNLEFGIGLRDNANFNLGRLKVNREYVRETSNGQLDCLLFSVVL